MLHVTNTGVSVVFYAISLFVAVLLTIIITAFVVGGRKPPGDGS